MLAGRRTLTEISGLFRLMGQVSEFNLTHLASTDITPQNNEKEKYQQVVLRSENLFYGYVSGEP